MVRSNWEDRVLLFLFSAIAALLLSVPVGLLVGIPDSLNGIWVVNQSWASHWVPLADFPLGNAEARAIQAGLPYDQDVRFSFGRAQLFGAAFTVSVLVLVFAGFPAFNCWMCRPRRGKAYSVPR